MKIKELREKIKEKGLDAFITRQNAQYLTETTAATAVIVSESRSVLICGRLELERAELEAETDEIRAYMRENVPTREDEDIQIGKLGEIMASTLEELGASNIGYDSLSNSIFEDLEDSYKANYKKYKDLLWDLRKIKTEEEIERLKKAAEIAKKGLEKASQIIKPGITELEIAAEVEYTMRLLGSGGTSFDTIVATGENSCQPHAEPSEKELEKGETVVVDLGAKWRGYKSDMTRTFGVSPTPEQNKLIEISKESQRAAIEKIEPGVAASNVDEAARKVFRKTGYEEFYPHSTGHGVGLDIHEPPRLSPSSEDKLKEGMVITIEPGIYVKGVGAGRFEDMAVVTEDGYKLLP